MRTIPTLSSLSWGHPAQGQLCARGGMDLNFAPRPVSTYPLIVETAEKRKGWPTG
jgi:hypothetical protein